MSGAYVLQEHLVASKYMNPKVLPQRSLEVLPLQKSMSSFATISTHRPYTSSPQTSSKFTSGLLARCQLNSKWPWHHKNDITARLLMPQRVNFDTGSRERLSLDEPQLVEQLACMASTKVQPSLLCLLLVALIVVPIATLAALRTELPAEQSLKSSSLSSNFPLCSFTVSSFSLTVPNCCCRQQCHVR